MAEKLSDKSFFRRLNTTGLAANTVANYDINFNETRLTQRPDITLKMPDIHSIYCGILQENGE